jgi:hypothetical protein
MATTSATDALPEDRLSEYPHIGVVMRGEPGQEAVA